MNRLFLSAILCSAEFLCAQTPAVPAGEGNRLITLNVLVTDKSGKPVSDLAQQDFTLLDNKDPQKIVSFRAPGERVAGTDPVQVILLLDQVNTSFSNVARERSDIEKFLAGNGGELPRPVTLAMLSDSGATISNTSTRDGKAVIAELEQQKFGLRTITRSQGFYGAAERMQLSVRGLGQLVAFEATKPGHKLVIWVSPGWPYLSGPREELSRKDQDQIFRNIVDLSDGLRRADITLYSIDPLGTADAGGLRTSFYEQFLKGIKRASQVQLADLSLQVLAYQSGGRVLSGSNDVAAEIAASVADANAWYEISFEGAVGDGPDEYHAIEIRIDKPKLTAHTRTGYYAQPR